MAFAINNCRLDLEDRELLKSLPQAPMNTAAWKAFKRPAEVTVSDWYKKENQGQIGSCQGAELAGVLERLAFVKGKKVQLSKIFAYLATQKIDGLLGSDNGSTISGGGKLALTVGVPLESITGYPSRYPKQSDRVRILSPENYKAAEDWKAESIWACSQSQDETLDFIGGGGGLSFGISWYQELIPSDRIVRSFQPSRYRILGGHAMNVLGYNKDGNLRANNSHNDGEYIIMWEAWMQMLRDRNTAAIGLMGNKEAAPIDWYTNSPYFK
jgi:hypothetical protein